MASCALQTSRDVELHVPPTFEQIARKAGRKAMNGGFAGVVAQAGNVCTLMWMRTIMNCQYRHGGTAADVARGLWAEGGAARFYRGFVPALLQAPILRFTAVAANDGTMAALEHTRVPTAAKTVGASVIAAGCRGALMPLDAWKTMLQVEGKDGVRKLMAKSAKHPTALWQGAAGAMAATCVAFYPFFYTNNQLSATLPAFNFRFGRYMRDASIGFASAAVADSCSNSLRVLKTVRQTSTTNIGYLDAATDIVSREGYAGLFGRGLRIRIAVNGVQGALFTVSWKAMSEHLNKET